MKMKVPIKFYKSGSPSHVRPDPTTREQSTAELLKWISDVTIKRRSIRRSTHCSNLFAEAILSSALRKAKKELAIFRPNKGWVGCRLSLSLTWQTYLGVVVIMGGGGVQIFRVASLDHITESQSRQRIQRLVPITESASGQVIRKTISSCIVAHSSWKDNFLAIVPLLWLSYIPVVSLPN
jgi:hypothetical protein